VNIHTICVYIHKCMYVCTCVYIHVHVCHVYIVCHEYIDMCIYLFVVHLDIIIDPWALRSLVVREIDCGNWLARGYMPAHKHRDLFYPLVGDLHGCAIK